MATNLARIPKELYDPIVKPLPPPVCSSRRRDMDALEVVLADIDALDK
jgi:hypothetical protein